MTPLRLLATIVAVAAATAHAQSSQQQDTLIHLNQIQVIGSHNSYNQGFAPSEEKWTCAAKRPQILQHSLEYRHASLTAQLDGGVRQLEIDIFADPQGGRFAHPKIVELTKQAGLPADPDFDPQHKMDKPGFKVIHIQDLNQRSSCPLFVDCLREIQAWSKAHPEHIPLFLLIETKSGTVKDIPNSVVAEPFTPPLFDALDKEIRSVFTDSEMVLPDQVRGDAKTLEAAILAGHWPTLAKSRGKVIFLMDQKKAGPIYTQGHPLLEHRILFTNADPGQPDAAFIEENNGTPALIDSLVKRGYLVRARADEGTVAARNNDTTRRDDLLRSGAQMISTDYPLSEPSTWSGYSVGFPGGLPARCNPANAPAGCHSEILEPDAKSGGTASPIHPPVRVATRFPTRTPKRVRYGARIQQMVSRRTFLGAVSAVSATGLVNNAFALPSFLASPGDTAATDHTGHVKLAIGTGGHGHCFPGATVPFGAVQLSPDTGIKDWDHCSGYHYDDSSILGFSHTHLSGTGCIDLLDVLLMPATDDFHFDFNAKPGMQGCYRSSFSHDEEQAVPGYYSVLLKDSKVKAELTATERTGLHRYTFPQSDKSVFLLDFAHAGDAGTDAAHPELPPTPSIRWSSLRIIGNDTIVGGRCTDVWAKGRQVYFAMKFSRPFDKADVYEGSKLLDPSTGEIKGTSLRVVLHLKTHANEAVQVKTGISGVDIAGAQGNLTTEAPGWDFDAIRTSAHTAWRHQLDRIHIAGGDPKYLQIFYTGLYHMMVAPTLFDDADGKYRGMDGKVHTLPKGEHNFSTFSLWDTYRAAHPMYTLMLPERVTPMVNCLIRMAEQSPEGVPVWPLQGSETGCMDGYHSAPVVAEAIAKGFPGIDPKAAYAVFNKRADHDDYRGLAAYRKLGYVPCDQQDESCSKTCDYAYDDSAVAAIARAAGDSATADMLLARSRNFTNLYDKESGFIRPRYADGHWATPFNPKSIVITKWRDYTEANAWQTTFLVQHESEGLDRYPRRQSGLRYEARRALQSEFGASSGYASRCLRHGRPVCSRQRTEPSHRVPLQLRRCAAQDAGTHPFAAGDDVRQPAQRHGR